MRLKHKKRLDIRGVFVFKLDCNYLILTFSLKNKF